MLFRSTLQRSIPLIYSGQEEPFLDSISFFYKDTITFSRYARAQFYSILLHLRQNTPALAANAASKKLSTTNNQAIYAFERSSGPGKIVVITNLSRKPQDFEINDADVNGDPVNVFTAKKETINNHKKFHLDAWGYLVYKY